MSMERLINLAKKTGDKLIIHDSVTGHDMVILSIDDYEELLRGREEFDFEDDECEYKETHPSYWHKTSDIISLRNKMGNTYDIDDSMYEVAGDISPDSSVSFSDEDDLSDAISFNDNNSLGFDADERSAQTDVCTHEPDVSPKITVEALGESVPIQGKSIEYSNTDSVTNNEIVWNKAEPLSDEPIFYEEPV